MNDSYAREARTQTLIDLMQALNPKDKITSQSKMRGTTLEKLAYYGSGGYQRSVQWFEEKLAEKRVYDGL